jgi:hypothetical protein
MRRGIVILAGLGWVSLVSCGGAPAPSSANASATTEEESRALPASASTDIADTTCGSLAPLLEMLPVEHLVGGLPEAYRHCDPGAYSVAVGYGQAGPQFSGYEFTIKVLDGTSPYVASLLDSATSDMREVSGQLVTSSGDIYKSLMTVCAQYVSNPIVPDGRNPVITKIKGEDVCIRDDLDPHRDIWNAIAVYGDLGVQLTLRGDRAVGIKTAESARADLAPLFGLVNVGGGR